jgi:hypothetical protein
MVIHYANAPRAAVLILLTITIFLFTFVLTGCMYPNSVFSSVYILKFSYNHDSPFFKLIENGTIVQHSNGAYIDQSNLNIKLGVMGICTEIGSDIRCASQNVNTLNRTEIHPVSNISIPTINSHSITENLLDDTIKFLNRETYAMIMITLVLMGIAFVSIMFVSFFLVPATDLRALIGDIALVGAALFALVSCVMMSRDALTAKKNIGNSGLVTINAGKKAAAMYWTGFAFMVVCVALLRTMRFRLKDEVKVENAKRGMRA